MKKSKGIVMGSALAAMLLLTACTSEEPTVKDSEKESGTEQTQTAEKAHQNLKIGETVVLKDKVEITLNSVKQIPGGDFDTAENGKFLVVDVTVTNNSDKEVTVSSLVEYELKDAEGYGYTTALVLDGVKSQLDGSVPAGSKLRGQIAYDVPESEYYEFTHSEVFSGQTSVWKITPAEIAK